MCKEQVFENHPIILKDRYDVLVSEIGYREPILDEYGNLVHYKEITKEEYYAKYGK